MGLLRHRDDRHERFQIREDLISIGDDYWVEDDPGNKVFRVDGKALRFQEHVDPGGCVEAPEVAQIRREEAERSAMRSGWKPQQVDFMPP